MNKRTDTTTLTFDRLLELYIQHHTLRPATVKSYRKILDQFLRFTGPALTPETLTQDTVLAWQTCILEERRRTPQTWNTYLRHMGGLFSWAMEENLVTYTKSPFCGRLVREGKKPKKTLTDPQLLRICDELNALKEREETGTPLTARRGRRSAFQPVWFWRTAVHLLMLTGIRRNQLLHIRRQDVEISGENVTRILLRREGSKNHDERWLPLPAELTAELRQLCRKARQEGMPPDNQLFNVAWFMEGMEDVKVNGMTERQTDSFFYRLSELCGFRVSTHRFRHTLATALMKDPDRNVTKVKELLGHRSLASTLAYIEHDATELRNMLSHRVQTLREQPRAGKFLLD
ncbi:TPA: site-specific integrase [Klebsiella oxytoca]|nr:site-specific integrase [Klebsiella oxytoca]